ncbi:hypothetical protein [Tabrizicola oligotrophica]|uniref:Uncharacterized protein n=1 Tax=Tabrizicola oligotrophica TaxID=2710650 RepID=A0A6M0QXH9_9RHOB|nr:hypothetical protein [Tabrizicola oligotrophica]NEY92165.1 hypothetical protein [Tabrizicola oligotrophica]
MADYFTQFSCLLDLGSAANALAAHRLYTELRDEDETRAEPLCSGFELTLLEGEEAHLLWIHEDGSGDVEQVIGFVLRLTETFDLTGLWGFDYANTCSRPRIDAFGGGAHVVDLGARKSVGWTSTQTWLAVALNGEDIDA